jgi:hypothetical protein
MKKQIKKTPEFISIEQSIKAGNDLQNQEIKRQFVAKHVYCNVNSLAEFVLKNSESDNAPFTIDEIENLYSFPEWSKTLLGESLYFGGGQQSDKDTFLEEFERLESESQTLFDNEEISEETHERNIELVNEGKEEFEEATEESEPADIMEWWAVSEFLYRKLKENGYCVVDAGSCFIWGRCTSGQAILLDHSITQICADMQILEGQENSWSK